MLSTELLKPLQSWYTFPKWQFATVSNIFTLNLFSNLFKGALYIIRCGVNRLGDSGVKVV